MKFLNLVNNYVYISKLTEESFDSGHKKRFPEMAVFSFDDTGMNPLIKVANLYSKNKWK